jgi:peptidoglycan/LPS O-acetylase OafA/YrhL
MPRVALGARFYIPQLDGLRFLAFLGVFVAHVSAQPPPSGHVSWPEWWGSAAIAAGAFGVDLFFVLSSYLITSLLVRELDAEGRIDVPAFWARRALRIWPLYFTFLCGYGAIGGLSAPAFIAFALFAGNWGIVALGLNAGHAGILWSVSVEEQFYVTWPLILATLPRRFLRHAALGLVGVSVATRYALFMNGASLANVWLNSLTHLDAIGIGAVIALGPKLALSPAVRGALGAASAFVIVACAGSVWFELLASPSTYLQAGAEGRATLVFLAVSVACGGLLSAAIAGSAWLSRPKIVYLGRISYGLYVFHSPAMWLVGEWWWPYRLPAAFAVTLAFAAVSYRFFERPFLRMKTRFTYVPSEARLPSP